MKVLIKRKILSIIIFFLAVNANSQSKGTADSIVLKNLEIVRQHISNPNIRPPYPVNLSVSFFELLTGIASESDGNYAGKTAPTKRDYELWYVWYEFNKKYISWDKESKTIALCKTVIPPKVD